MGGMTRHLPLAFQYICTNGACHAFAAAALSLPACAEAVAVSFDEEDRDHIALRLADGRYLDAEGVRTRADLLADFAFGTPTEEQVALSGDPSVQIEAMIGLLHAYGWATTLPEYDPDATATTNWKKARRQFDGAGGWTGDPVAMILAWTEAEERRTVR